VVHPHDSYIIKVSESRYGKPVGTELGSFSFYPPPLKDESIQHFFLPAGMSAADAGD
jgi:hypothetical protein